MEGKKFSSSKRVVIYVRDLLSRYQPDAFRYFVAAAGPENQDSDFTWSEFVRRTNDELVAGWGNLVNRTADLIAKNFGEIPKAGELTAEDQALLDATEAAFGTVGDLLERHRLKQAIGEAMRAVAEVNKYVSDTEPWKIKDDPRAARHGPARRRAVRRRPQPDASARSCRSRPTRSTRRFGGAGDIAPMPRIEEAEDLDGGAPYPIITGDYSGYAGLGAPADRAGHAGRQADADLHQARPVDRGRGARAAGGRGELSRDVALARRGPRAPQPPGAQRAAADARRRHRVGAERLRRSTSATYDGVWLVPGSPYADDAAVLARADRGPRARHPVPRLLRRHAVRRARVRALACSASRATHAESDGEADDNVVSASPAACTARSGW